MIFRPLPNWPGEQTRDRRGFVFSASWQSTLDLLERELDHLGAENVVIQADFNEGDIRLDGMIRSHARTPSHPGVILSFESRHGPLQYRTDAHHFWQHNVRAIALGLEDLRAIERYGITKTGQQYTGWRQLTAGSGITSRGKAIALIADLIGVAHSAIALDGNGLVSQYRQALKRAHPDLGGSVESMVAVRDAGRILGVN